MRSWLFLAPPLGLTALLALSAAGRPTAPPKPIPPDLALNQAVWPYFAKNCTDCHNAEVKAGALDLESLRRKDSLVQSRETWEAITRKIQTGEMPPKESPRPNPAESHATVARITAELERIDRETPPNPGSVTAHRLNRAEYNNTVHDLLGVTFRPADDFPQDDSGYGFDNMGDVLSLSPSQMEKYVAAAEKVARTAVFGPEQLQPTLVQCGESGRHIEVGTTIPARYDVTGLTLPNSLHVTYRFPVEGEYVFRFKLGGTRPLGSAPLALALWIDGKQVQAVALDAEGAAGFAADRQDFSGRTQEVRFRVTAGDHWIAAVLPRFYEGLPASYKGPNPSLKVIPPPVFKPRPGIPPEKLEEFRKRFEARQKEVAPTNDARVGGLDIGGPYAQAKGPSEASLRQIFVCGHQHGGHNATCARQIVTHLAERAFRRPVTAQEVSRLTGLVTLAQKQGDSFDEGICLALQGILVSPHFLFRIERDPIAPRVAAGSPTLTHLRGGGESLPQPRPEPTPAPALAAAATHPISQYELASRLSYFLWSTMPDNELRACADHQTLRNPTVLKAQVRRMLLSPKSHALAENFAGQWLQFRSLESAKPDKEKFPGWDNYLRLSMREETERYFDSMVRDDRSVLDLLLGKYTFLNERLANFYGIPGVSGPDFRRVDLTGTARGGILTQASVLTVTSYPNRTSPVLRGKWILENLFNAPPPAPPPGVPNLDTTAVGSATSLRQQLEEHRKNPTCASCHARMDPLGFGLENFDAIGQWRGKDGEITIDSSGSLPDGRTFNGPDGLRTILKADREAFVQCLTAKLLTYGLGRGLERYDRSTVKDISKHVAANNYRFSSLVLEIVNSRPFQLRKESKLP